ncbi:MAG: DNA/RNA nuclease SfsA [Ruminococcaceae bacterium]|nr:DNA/RNA nuclease SfsA [Oscillospiraceae bacterium]
MKLYHAIKKGRFIARPNRFIAHIEIDGQAELCHVKNTGRLRELLVPGAAVYVETSLNPLRKTKYDLVAVERDGALINIDSSAPNAVFGEWVQRSGFFGNIRLLWPETTYKNSRFDFYIETETRKIFIEVKGVTLIAEDGIVCFPDAPTARGTKHLRELTACVQEGFEAAVFFIAQMEQAAGFSPNTETDPSFALALHRAAENGVGIYCLTCHVSPQTLQAKDFVPIFLP